MKEMLVVGILETPDSDYLVSGGDLDFVFVVLVVELSFKLLLTTQLSGACIYSLLTLHFQTSSRP